MPSMEASKLAYMKLQDMKLQDRTKLARKKVGLTQKGLADRVGIKPQAVSQWESGKTKSLRGPSLARAADALGVNPLWLSDGEGPMLNYAVRDEPYTVPPELTRAWQKLDKQTREHLLAIATSLAEWKK